MTTYYNVPSDGAINAKQAYEIARKRWDLQVQQNRDESENAGICFQGDGGETVYLKWSELPPVKRIFR